MFSSPARVFVSNPYTSDSSIRRWGSSRCQGIIIERDLPLSTSLWSDDRIRAVRQICWYDRIWLWVISRFITAGVYIRRGFWVRLRSAARQYRCRLWGRMNTIPWIERRRCDFLTSCITRGVSGATSFLNDALITRLWKENISEDWGETVVLPPTHAPPPSPRLNNALLALIPLCLYAGV